MSRYITLNSDLQYNKFKTIQTGVVSTSTFITGNRISLITSSEYQFMEFGTSTVIASTSSAIVPANTLINLHAEPNSYIALLSPNGNSYVSILDTEYNNEKYIPQIVDWTPVYLSNKNVWFDALDTGTVVLSAGRISEWSDKSGNARNATQENSDNRPYYQADSFNNKPAISFEDFYYLETSQFSNHINDGNPLTSIMVIKPNLSWNGAFMSPIGTRSDGGSWWTFLGPNPDNTYIFHGDQQYNSGVNINNSSTIIVDVVNNNILNTYINGTNVINSQSIFPFGLNLSPKFYIGAGSQLTTNENYEGLIAEIIITSSELSLEDRQKIEGYLAWKWDMVNILPVDHPYKATTPKITI